MDNQTLKIYLSLLKSAGLSNTACRRLVFSQIKSSSHELLTIGEIINNLNGKVDRASVYRCVESLENAGLIKKVHTGWKYKLETSEAFHPHHHHITCVSCSKISVLHVDALLEENLRQKARSEGFSYEDHQIEIRGVCDKCQENHSKI